MSKLARIFLVVLIAAFAVGMSVAAASDAIMDAEMASVAGDTESCQGCAEDGVAPCCDGICTVPVLALTAPDLVGSGSWRGLARPLGVFSLAGHAVPPDPSPPKSTS